MDLLIIGAGQLGQVAREIAVDCGYENIKFIDDNSSRDDVVGNMSQIGEVSNEFNNVIVAIGNNEKRYEIISLLPTSLNLVTLIHPRSYVSRSAVIEEGCIIMPMSSVNTDCVIKRGSIIGLNAVVDHNAVLEECTHVDCGANVRPSTCLNKFSKVQANEVYKIGG